MVVIIFVRLHGLTQPLSLHKLFSPGGTDGSFRGMTCETNIFFFHYESQCVMNNNGRVFALSILL